MAKLPYLICAVFVLIASTASATTSKTTTPKASPVTKPACIAKALKARKPYGTATLNKLFFHVYDAEFWTDGKGLQDSKPYALHLTYQVSIEKQDFLDRTMKELKRQPEVSKKMLEEFRTQLKGIYPDVKDGDSITALHVPKGGVQFCFNGKPIGQLKNEALVKPFFGIWLGKNTSEPKVRDQLLKR
jgi:hypothetical protein